MKIRCNIIGVIFALFTFAFYKSCATAQEVPVIDWQALQATKPWSKTEVWEPAPLVVTPGHQSHQALGDAIVLFDGTDLSQWRKPRYDCGARMDQVSEPYVPGRGIVWNIHLIKHDKAHSASV